MVAKVIITAMTIPTAALVLNCECGVADDDEKTGSFDCEAVGVCGNALLFTMLGPGIEIGSRVVVLPVVPVLVLVKVLMVKVLVVKVLLVKVLLVLLALLLVLVSVVLVLPSPPMMMVVVMSATLGP